MKIVSPNEFYRICDKLQEKSNSDTIAFDKHGLPYISHDSDENNHEISKPFGKFILAHANANPNLLYKGIDTYHKLRKKGISVKISKEQREKINKIKEQMDKADRFIKKGKHAESMEEAKGFYKQARELKSARGIFELARLYDKQTSEEEEEEESSEPIEKDSEMTEMAAAELYKEAADLGHAKAQYYYAICLRDGTGVDINIKEAYDYFLLAAKQNWENEIRADAQISVGNCLESGVGVNPDIARALKYYKKAADQNNEIGEQEYNRLKAIDKKRRCILS